MSLRLKILSLITLLLNAIYLVWFVYHTESSLGWILFFAECLILSNLILFIYNSWTQKHIVMSNKIAQGDLDIFLTVVNEPIALFEKTLAAACNIDYPNKTIYVLDDGQRPEIKDLAIKYQSKYITRPNREHNKAGNLNFGLSISNGEFILVMDADQIAKPAIARDLLGFFNEDPQIALVTTKQTFSVPGKDFNHDHLFYRHIQSGGNNDNAAFSNGSGVLYRRSALLEINGFDTWNLVEDLTTSYQLHARGFRSLYINKAYSVGTAPMSITTIYKQRGTWALDTLRLFFRQSPLIKRGLSIRQRIHYFEICWQYIVSAISTPILCILPAVSLVLNIPIISLDTQYLLFRVPSMALIYYYYYRSNGNSLASGQYWTALFPIYLKALFLAIWGKKTKYVVTTKVPITGINLRLVYPHIFLIELSLSALIWRIFVSKQSLEGYIGIYVFWFVIMIFWFYPLIKKALLPETKLEQIYLNRLEQDPFVIE